MAQNNLRQLAARIARNQIDPFLPGGPDDAIRLFAALISQESGWNPSAGSPAGARGLTQLMPGTAAGLGVKNILDPEQNLRGGAKYLAAQLRAFGGDLSKALAAYNAGPGAVQKYGGIPPYAETQNYVKRILGNFRSGNIPVPAASRQPVNDYSAPGLSAGVGGVNSPDLGLKLYKALSANADPATLASIVQSGRRAPTAPGLPPPSLPGLPGSKAPGIGQQVRGKARGGLAEAFYDPIGAYDEGSFISPIGGHSDHVHLSFKNAAAALAAIKYAQRIGLSARENPYVDPVDPVHTKTSYHYRTFPGKYNGRQLGEAGDFSGSPQLMAQLYKWALANLR